MNQFPSIEMDSATHYATGRTTAISLFPLDGTWLAVYPRELLAQAEAAGGRIVKPAQDIFCGYSGTLKILMAIRGK